MSTNKSTVLMFIMIFFVCRTMQTCTFGNFTRDQLLGVWYSIGTTSSQSISKSNVSCYRMNITAEAGPDQNFKQSITFLIDGNLKEFDAYGKFINSVALILFPYTEGGVVVGLTCQNDGQEMIIHDEAHPTSSFAMISRQHSVSVQTKKTFEDLAKKSDTSTVYFNYDNCSY